MIEIVDVLGGLSLRAVAAIPAAVGLFTRLSLFMMMLPGVAGKTVPVRIRVALAASLMLLLLPLAGGSVPLGTPADLAAFLGGEAFVGLVFGFGVRVLLFALNITGSVIAQTLSLSQIFGVTAEGDSASLLSTALTMAGATLFLTSGLGAEAIGLFARQLDAVPLGSFSTLDAGRVAEEMTALASSTITLGIMLALPFMVLNFAFYILLGLLNRVMPQLMVTFVGLPALTLGGLIVFFGTAGILLSVWLARMTGMLMS